MLALEVFILVERKHTKLMLIAVQVDVEYFKSLYITVCVFNVYQLADNER
jgi:hypothetical protein